MKNMASWLITIFIVTFWIFRLVVAFLASMAVETGFNPIDMMTEIIVLFVSFFCILLIIKRNIIGGILYAIVYGYYFGITAFNGIMNIINAKGISNLYIQGGMEILISLVAIFLAIFIVADLAFNKDRAEEKDNKNTHWFYKNKKYERKLDERADKNQYRTR